MAGLCAVIGNRSVVNIIDMPLNQITRYARNPRKNAQAVAKVKASLKEFGPRQPIVVDREHVIIVGDTRYQAAMELEWDTYPVHIAENLTPAQAKAYRLADNRTGDEATWDYELLALEIEDLGELDVDLELTGFSEFELANLTQATDGSTDPYTEWQGMPEFDQEDQNAFRSIKINFASEEDVKEFSQLLGQTITDKTRFLWFPEQKKITMDDKAYLSSDA